MKRSRVEGFRIGVVTMAAVLVVGMATVGPAASSGGNFYFGGDSYREGETANGGTMVRSDASHDGQDDRKAAWGGHSGGKGSMSMDPAMMQRMLAHGAEWCVDDDWMERHASMRDDRAGSGRMGHARDGMGGMNGMDRGMNKSGMDDGMSGKDSKGQGKMMGGMDHAEMMKQVAAICSLPLTPEPLGISDAEYEALALKHIIVHDSAAVELANQAGGNAEHAELADLASRIATARQTAIDQASAWVPHDEEYEEEDDDAAESEEANGSGNGTTDNATMMPGGEADMPWNETTTAGMDANGTATMMDDDNADDDANETFADEAAETPLGMAMMAHARGIANASGNASFDEAFIDAMIAHTLKGIHLLDNLAEHAADPAVAAWAWSESEARRADVSELRDWREAWYRGGPMPGGADAGAGAGGIGNETGGTGVDGGADGNVTGLDEPQEAVGGGDGNGDSNVPGFGVLAAVGAAAGAAALVARRKK